MGCRRASVLQDVSERVHSSLKRCGFHERVGRALARIRVQAPQGSYKRKKTRSDDDLVEKEVSEEDVLMDDEPDDYALLELPARPAATEPEEV